MNHHLRPGTEDDLASIFAVHQQSVQGACAGFYSSEQIERWFDGRSPSMYLPLIQKGKVLVASDGGKICAFIGVTCGEVVSLFVLPTHLKNGLGRRLLDSALPFAQKSSSGQISAIATLNAVPFYSVYGFRYVEDGWFERGSPPIKYPVVKMVYKPLAHLGADNSPTPMEFKR